MEALEDTGRLYACDTGLGGCGKVTGLRMETVPCCSPSCQEKMLHTLKTNEEEECRSQE